MKNLLSIIKTSAIILILSGFCRTGEGYCQPQLLPNWPVEIGTEHSQWVMYFLGGVNWINPPGELSSYYLCGFGTATNPNRGIYLWNQYADSISGWPIHDTWDILYSPAVGDIDNDGQSEIVVSSRWRPLETHVYAFELDGSIVNGWPVIIEQRTYAQDGLSCPVLYDLNGDNTLEIIHISNVKNRIDVWNHDGTDFPGWPVILDEELLFYGVCPAVGDIDLDGQGEIVTYYGGTTSDSNRISQACVYEADGSVHNGWPVPIEDGGYFLNLHPTIADFDGDALPDIVVGAIQYSNYGSYLYMFEEDGTIKNGWPVFESMPIIASPVAADIDLDGLPEVIVPNQREHGFLSAYEFNGEIVEGWNHPDLNDDMVFTDPIILDIQDDDYPEILCTSNISQGPRLENGFLLAMNNMGCFLDWSPIQVIGLTMNQAPAVFNIYPSGDRVLTIATEYEILDSLYNPIGYHHLSYMYGLGPDEDFAPPEWPRFAHDPQNTCNYHHPLQTSVHDGDDEQLPRNLRLYNYPNPFNARTNIILDLPRESEVKVEVFNIYGQRIEKLIDERLEAGNHTLQWDAVGYASGVYFYKLTTSKVTLSRKMVMVK